MTHGSATFQNSLNLLQETVRRFGSSAGMPFLELDDEGAAAVRLESGSRFELEYVPEADRLFLHVELDATVPGDPETWMTVSRENAGWVSRFGFALGLGLVDGEERLLLMTSLPAADLTPDSLGETAVLLVEAATSAAGRLREPSASAAASADEIPQGYFRA